MPLHLALTGNRGNRCNARSSMNDEVDKTHDKIWFLKKGEKVFGPFAAAKVRNFLLEGKIDMRDQVSRDRKNWVFLKQQPEVVPLQMRDPEQFADTEYSDALDPGRKGSLWLPILLVIILIAAGIGTSVLLQQEQGGTAYQTDCTAAAEAGVNWNSCNKRGFVAENQNLDNMSANNGKLEESRFSGSSMKNANLKYAQLDKTDLSYTDLSGAVLKGASLRGADLGNAILNNADLRYSDLTDARLGGIQLDNARLEGVIWNNGQTCKPGSIGECIQ